MAKDKRKVLQNRAKKIARATAKAAKRKKTASTGGPDFMTRFGASRSAIRSAPLHRVLVSQSIFSLCIGDVLVSRKLENGLIALGLVLLDPYCLGVKNAFLRVTSQGGFDELLERSEGTQTLDEVAPEYACKLVDDAVAYARSLGFEPHADFKDAAVVLEGIDPTSCAVQFTFGKDGKPLYVNGPHHSAKQSRQIIAHLATRLGPEGFHYLMGGEVVVDAG